MKIPLTPIFEEQKRRYSFCFTCEDCVHFDCDTGECIHEFPNHMHTTTCYDASPPPSHLVFCKDFDLG